MRVAVVIQSVLLGLFAAIGLALAVFIAIDWFRGLETWFWKESTCTIVSSTVQERPDYGDALLRVEYRYHHRGEELVGHGYRHGYSGSDSTSDAAVLASRYQEGDSVRCWVDPDEPESAFLLRSNLWAGFWILAPLVFFVVGAGGLWLLHGTGLRVGDEGPHDSAGMPEKARTGLKAGVWIFAPLIFFLFGAAFLVPFFLRPALEVVSARFWDEVPCEIESSGVQSHSGEDGATYSVDVLFRYQVDGREYRSNRYQFMGGSSSGYEGKARTVASLQPGTSTTCYVNPDDPFDAVIERGFTSEYLFGLIPLIFVLVGAGGLVFAFKAMQIGRQEAAAPSWSAPSWTGAASSSTPSTRTARARTPVSSSGGLILEPAMGRLSKLGCAASIALFWNGFLSIFVWQVIESWKAGRQEWFVIVILTPFVLIGLLLLLSIPHSILGLLNPKPRLELAPGVLTVGRTAHLRWTFTGFARRLRRLQIWLTATEVTTERSESGLRMKTRAMDTPAIPVVDLGPESILDRGSADFEIPDGTPPSSDGEHSVRWKLELHGDIGYWPDVEESCEVRIVAGDSD